LHGMTGIYIYGNAPTGINSISEDKLSIYPNPCKNNIYLESSKLFDSYMLTDITGRMVNWGFVTDSKIDVSQINSGIYILSAITKDGKKSSVKIVKE
jgi:hypothetical protein